MTVRTMKKPDGTNQIVHVENDMEVVYDDLVAKGVVREECRVDWLAHSDKFVIGPSGALIEKDSGLSVEAYALDLLKTRPHWAVPVYTDRDAEICSEGATLAKRAAFLRDFGEQKYRETLAAWGCSEFNLKPGVRPMNMKDGTTPANIDPRLSKDAIAYATNPFAHLRKADGTIDADRMAEVEALIKAEGTQHAIALAAKVGKRLDGRDMVRR